MTSTVVGFLDLELLELLLPWMIMYVDSRNLHGNLSTQQNL